MKKIIVATLLAVCCLGTFLHAQSVTYLLDYEGIPGSSVIKGYENKIEVLSYSHGVSRTVSSSSGGGSARTVGAPEVGEMSIFMALDTKANVELTRAAFTGQGKLIKLIGLLNQGDAAPRKFLEIELTEGLISSLTQEGSNGNQVYLNLSLNFLRIKFTTIPVDPRTGQPGTPVSFSYDLEKRN
ncbi:MAG: type VI secretion system tube protein Hcp [Verrucomicrobiaceae bacterium]|nr:MAG: type VI secretion system tube protein Hcp [Verrucomicrobiaceae bacterium]